MKIHLVSFATTYKDIGYPDTELRQQRLIESAKKHGINSFFTWTRQKLLKTDFYNQNKFILDHKIGAGYWLWKPYIILDALEKVEEGDIVFYIDNSFFLINDIKPLVNICKVHSILLFKHSNDSKIKHSTQIATFEKMEMDYDEYKNNTMFGAGIQVYMKNKHSINFVREYLRYCLNPKCLIENYRKEDSTFKQHKHDMSILSLLATKYEIQGYRIPYQHGNHQKMEKYRIPNEFLLKDTYSDIDIDSEYPTIFHWDKDGMYCKRPLLQKINPIFIYYKLFKQ